MVPLAFSFEGKPHVYSKRLRLLPPAHFSSIRLPKIDICTSISIPWATILASRGYFGGPWKKQEGHEVVQNQIFIGFGSIFGLCFDAFWALRLEIGIYFRGRFQVTYCTVFLGRNLDARGSYNTFAWPKTHFHRQQHRTDDC